MNKIVSKISTLLLSLLLVFSCKENNIIHQRQVDDFNLSGLNHWNKILTDAMVKDIFSPPVASRIYVYANIAAYEILSVHNDSYKSLSHVIKHLGEIPGIDAKNAPDYPIAAIVAFAEVAYQLVYSYEMIAEAQDKYLKDLRRIGVSEKKIKNAVDYGKIVADYILKWAEEDGYKGRNNTSQVIKNLGIGTWQPTPPDFLEPIEPNWNKLRTFIIDSANQFKPGEPTEFNIEKSSQFYQESYHVYEKVKNSTKEEVEIAQFWDCNPNASHHMGHLMKFQQKISPGAHWILITSEATTKATKTLIERSMIFTSVALALADGFISCWAEKYRSVVIRPETYINKYIDEDWKPILQTPAFPEYTSGHSVVSAASATILTSLLGDKFAFKDSTEVDYGLPVRSFESFNAAAEEAAISRLYGGIHYMPAIENGVRQGRTLGHYIAQHLSLKLSDQ